MGRRKPSVVPFRAFETRSPSGIDKHYLRLTNAVYRSDSYKDLTDSARNMFIDMRMTARGELTVKYSQKIAKKAWGYSSSTYASGIELLIKVGLLKRMPRSKYDPNQFEFSAEWKNYRSPNRDMFTDEYIHNKKRGK